MSSDAEHFPQQTVWFCSYARKDSYGINTSLLNSQLLGSSANNMLIKQKHLCKCHWLIVIGTIFYIITGEWWRDRSFGVVLVGCSLGQWVLIAVLEQKAEPCFPIRAWESSWLCLWDWQGLVQSRAALRMFHIHGPGSFERLGMCVWGREWGVKPLLRNSHLDERLTSDLGLILQPCPNVTYYCALSPPSWDLLFPSSSSSTVVCWQILPTVFGKLKIMLWVL